jgi:hypothetical protein
MARRWTVYYSDGVTESTFSSGQGTPGDAPKNYVQAIVQENADGGRDLIDGMGTNYEFYCWHGDRWIIHNQNGLEQFLALDRKGIYLRGYHIADEAFREQHLKALDDPVWQDLSTRIVRASEWTG